MSSRTGQCLCGGVSFTAKGNVVEADACHCSMCRRQGGGGPYFAVQFRDGVNLDKTDTLAWYRGSDHGERGFCTKCGASIAWRLQSQPEKMGVSLGALDTPSGITLDSHIFTDSAPDYYTVPTDAPHKTEAQVIQEFMERLQKAAQKEADNT